ncbi:C6 zinc finger domain protein [Aspergillus granulosus]|uniref:C6 zinc finger domain protein n=1 Tax=Aspergillus granulosus TaxID=176169 RepID=A0ABR4GWX4_9EURO
MVYPGKPSTGCNTCRSRHIKCDETRPHCNACTRSGRQCPGYPHPLDVMLRPQAPLLWKSGLTPQSAAPSGKSDNLDARQEEATQKDGISSELSCCPCLPQSSGASTLLPPPRIPGRLLLPLEDTVTGLFFGSYVYTPKDPLVRMGSMELLPQLYAAAPLTSPVRMGALAVSYFSVAAWTNQEHLLQLARQCFVDALTLTRKTLQGDIEQSFDELLMTMLLLYIYEEFDAMKENKQPSKAHLRGAIALINKCQPKDQDSFLSSTLKNAVQTEIINVSVDDSTPLVPPTDVWPLALPIRQLASSRLTEASTATVNLRQRWVQYSTASATNLNEVEAILSEACLVDSLLLAWTEALPQHWDPIPASFIPQSVRDAGIYQDRCDCHVDFWIAETWNKYRASRLAVQKIIMYCLQLLPDRAADMESTTEMIRAIATDTCATVPFFLGSQTNSVLITASQIEYPVAGTGLHAAHRQSAPMLGGWFIRPSLENLLSIEFLTEDQLGWVKGQVQRVLKIYTSGLMTPQS